MSVKVHEPVCLDSAQDLYFWFDHFLGDQIKDEWNSTIAGAGTTVVVDAQTGGIVRLLTGALNLNQNELDWGDIRSLLVTKKATIEVRMKQNQNVSMRILLSLRFDTNNEVDFFLNTAASANWFIETADGGGTTSSDSGIASDTSYHIYRIECHTHGSNHVHFYIDGTETGNSPITTNIPDDAADYLQPYLFIQTRENVAKSIDVDYVVARQER